MKCIFLLLLLFVGNMALSQIQQIERLDGSNISTFKIDQIVKRLLDSANVHGLNLAILNQNKTVYLKSFGYKNKPNNALLDTSTIVYGASFSKGVFGFLVMKLVEEKTLDLDIPLCEYLKKPLPIMNIFLI
ncbi:MAG: serine hydrolase [Saprospiraceae bacterium]|nr:serine hydrolase [Saprospiraceae bacterium]